MHIMIADQHSKARKALVALLRERRGMDVISEVAEFELACSSWPINNLWI